MCMIHKKDQIIPLNLSTSQHSLTRSTQRLFAQKNCFKPPRSISKTRKLVSLWTYQHGIHTQSTFSVCTIDLHHREFNLHWYLWVLDNKTASMIKNPLPWCGQVALRHCFLTIWSRQLEFNWLYIPPMNMVLVADPPPKPLAQPPKL